MANGICKKHFKLLDIKYKNRVTNYKDIIWKSNKSRYRNNKTSLLEHYSDAVTELNYTNDYELLIAIILSAQCTDKRVNIITPALFEKYQGKRTCSCTTWW